MAKKLRYSRNRNRSRFSKYERRRIAIVEVGDDGLLDELKRGTGLLSARSEYSPEAFAPTASAGAARALGDLTIDHGVTQGLFAAVVGRFDRPIVQESKVVVRVMTKAIGDVLSFFARRRPPSCCQQFHPSLGEPLIRRRSRKVVATMPIVKQSADFFHQSLAIVAGHLVG